MDRGRLFTDTLSFEQEAAIRAIPDKPREQLIKFVKSFESIRFFEPKVGPDKEWKIFYGDTWLKARTLASDVVMASFPTDWMGSAKREVEKVLGAAPRKREREAVQNIVREAITRSVWLSRWDGDLIGDAGYMASLLSVSDLVFNNKGAVVIHVKKRWDVWKNGYGLFNDVGGIFYVYARTAVVDQEKTMHQKLIRR